MDRRAGAPAVGPSGGRRLEAVLHPRLAAELSQRQVIAGRRSNLMAWASIRILPRGVQKRRSSRSAARSYSGISGHQHSCRYANSPRAFHLLGHSATARELDRDVRGRGPQE